MIEIGQVLLLKIQYDNQGTIANEAHPCLIVKCDNELGVIEVVQFDSLEGKEHKAMFKATKVVLNRNPNETVIDKDSFVNLDTKYQIEIFDELVRSRRQTDKLSKEKLDEVIRSYDAYHMMNKIFENKMVYMSKSDIISMNNNLFIEDSDETVSKSV